MQVEYDCKQYHITDSLLVGQVFRESWNKIHAEVSQGAGRKASNQDDSKSLQGRSIPEARGENVCIDLDVHAVKCSQTLQDGGIQHLSNENQDYASLCHRKAPKDGSSCGKNGMLEQRFPDAEGIPGSGLHCTEGPYTQPFSEANMAALRILGRGNRKRKSRKEAKLDAWKHSSPSDEDREMDAFLSEDATLDSDHGNYLDGRDQENKSECPCGAQQNLKKYLKDEDKGQEQKFPGQKSASSELQGSILPSLERNTITYIDEKLPSGDHNVGRADSCNLGTGKNGNNGKLNDKAEESSTEKATSSPLISNSRHTSSNLEGINLRNEGLLLKKSASSPGSSESSEDDETQETGLEKSRALCVNENDGNTLGPASMSADVVFETQESQIGTQIYTADIVKEIRNTETGKFLKRLDETSERGAKNPNTKPSTSVSVNVGTVVDQDGNANTAALEKSNHPQNFCSDRMGNNGTSQENQELERLHGTLVEGYVDNQVHHASLSAPTEHINPLKKHKKSKKRFEVQSQALPIQEHSMAVKQDFVLGVLNEREELEGDNGCIETFKQNSEVAEIRATPTDDPSTLALPENTEGSFHSHEKLVENKTASFVAPAEGFQDLREGKNFSELKPALDLELKNRSIGREKNRRNSFSHVQKSETDMLQHPEKKLRGENTVDWKENVDQGSEHADLLKQNVDLGLKKVYKKKKQQEKRQGNVDLSQHNSAEIEGMILELEGVQVDECGSKCSQPNSRKFAESHKSKGLNDAVIETNNVDAEVTSSGAELNSSLGERSKKRKHKRKHGKRRLSGAVDDCNLKGYQEQNLCADAENATGIDAGLIVDANALDVYEFNSLETRNERKESPSFAGEMEKKVAKELDRICSKAVDKVFDDDMLDPLKVRPRKTDRKYINIKRGMELLSERLMQSQSPAKGDSHAVVGDSGVQKATKSGSSMNHDGGLSEFTSTHGKIACPAGCGRLYAKKTSAFYRHSKRCLRKSM